MKVATSCLLTAILIIDLNIIQEVESNVLVKSPSDMSDINMTLLNSNLFDAVDTMKDTDQDNEIDPQDYTHLASTYRGH